MGRGRRTWGAAALSVLLITGVISGCSVASDRSRACVDMPNGKRVAGTPTGAGTTTTQNLSTNPEIASGFRTGMKAVSTTNYAVSTANPLATEAACTVLRDGGTAADALIAAQTMLGLVEPQASGIGGGAFLMYYDAARNTVDAYDGRETTPTAATENYLRWVGGTDHSEPKPDTRASGRSIGVPGVLRMLELAHNDHGRTPWPELLEPAISTADRGFPISPRLAAQIAASATDLARDPAAADYFLEPGGSPRPAGATMTNPAMSKTLGAIANEGADAFYTGVIAEDMVAAANSAAGGRTPSRMTTDDLANYQPKRRSALCADYREHQICGMPPPSSGGITVAAILGILQHFDLPALPPKHVDRDGGKPAAEAAHLIAEAERLAYADRNKYIADTDFVPLPGNSAQTLLNQRYLAQRAALIDPGRSMGTAHPGDLSPVPAGIGPQPPEHGTSHISVVDAEGNAAAMTTSVESAFGSFHMVDGFLLNNQLTDFSADPIGTDGLPIANRIEPGKRPRSSMSPTLVFATSAEGQRGEPTHVLGSPGGSVIIQFVVKTLVAMLDWGLDPQQAVGMVSFGAANSPETGVGGEHPTIDIREDGANDPLVARLRELGHQVSIAPQSSGIGALLRTESGWIGGADPRREGIVLGKTH